jgi:putative SOS response-associated peptidase YedK
MIQPRGSEICYMAGLYKDRRIPGLKYPVFSILTRAPSQELAKLHDRMRLFCPEKL